MSVNKTHRSTTREPVNIFQENNPSAIQGNEGTCCPNALRPALINNTSLTKFNARLISLWLKNDWETMTRISTRTRSLSSVTDSLNFRNCNLTS